MIYKWMRNKGFNVTVLNNIGRVLWLIEDYREPTWENDKILSYAAGEMG